MRRLGAIWCFASWVCWFFFTKIKDAIKFVNVENITFLHDVSVDHMVALFSVVFLRKHSDIYWFCKALYVYVKAIFLKQKYKLSNHYNNMFMNAELRVQSLSGRFVATISYCFTIVVKRVPVWKSVNSRILHKSLFADFPLREVTLDVDLWSTRAGTAGFVSILHLARVYMEVSSKRKSTCRRVGFVWIPDTFGVYCCCWVITVSFGFLSDVLEELVAIRGLFSGHIGEKWEIWIENSILFRGMNYWML